MVKRGVGGAGGRIRQRARKKDTESTRKTELRTAEFLTAGEASKAIFSLTPGFTEGTGVNTSFSTEAEELLNSVSVVPGCSRCLGNL